MVLRAREYAVHRDRADVTAGRPTHRIPPCMRVRSRGMCGTPISQGGCGGMDELVEPAIVGESA
jgi:hypothetical protein